MPLLFPLGFLLALASGMILSHALVMADPSPMILSQAPVTFEAAISQSQALLTAIAEQRLNDQAFAQQVKTLVQTENGARGFFVTYLTADLPQADQPSPALLAALQTSPEIVSELLVKNLAMASATAVLHRRQQSPELAQGSEQVRQRTVNLINQLALPPLTPKLLALKTTVTTGQGDYQAFIERWDYDAEQKAAILAAIAQVTSP